jgi:hypothetical protein
MQVIGFANKFYTLWDVTEDKFTDNNGRKGSRVYKQFLKNVSLDEQTARSKYPDAPIDMTLRGHSSFSLVKYESLPSDVFPCGKYMNKPIAQCTDYGYLLWCIDSMFDDERRAIAEEVLLSSGLYGKIGERILTIEQIADIEEREAKLDAYISLLEQGKSIDFVSLTNLIEPNDDPMFENDSFNDSWHYQSYIEGNDDITLVWDANNVTPMRYRGYDYGLPMLNGKGKRIKGKALTINASHYEVKIGCGVWRKLIIKVKDFTINK